MQSLARASKIATFTLLHKSRQSLRRQELAGAFVLNQHHTRAEVAGNVTFPALLFALVKGRDAFSEGAHAARNDQGVLKYPLVVLNVCS